MLLYLANCARLLAVLGSIPWQASLQHLRRLGCSLLGYLKLLLPKQSQHSPAIRRFSPRTCETPFLFLTLS